MNDRSWAEIFVGLFVLSVSIGLGLALTGIALDAILGRENDGSLTRVVRAVATVAVIFVLGGAYEAWKHRGGKA